MRILIIFSLYMFVFLANAQKDSTTIFTDTNIHDTIVNKANNHEIYQETEVFINDLDSLMTLWEIERSSYYNSQNDSIYYDTDSSFQPNVIQLRMANIESPIKFSYNEIIKRYIDLYANRYKKSTAKLMGLSNYYFPIFEQMLNAQNIPLELKYLPIIESALNPLATSPVGAAGLWQFMYKTAKFYGLNITSYIDERRDPIKSTKAAVAYLKDLHNIYNDWILAIAAFNCGPNNVNKAIHRANGSRNYWDIYYFLPRETRNYVPAFIAAAYTFIYYKEHNIIPVKSNFPPTIDTIFIQKSIHFKQLADWFNLDVTDLSSLNPQYILNIVPSGNRKYFIVLPNEYIGQFINNENAIYAFDREKYFTNEGSILMKPNTQYARHALTYSIEGKTKLYYTIKAGDVIGLIADWYDVPLSSLKDWNNIRRNTIRVGQKLTIFVPAEKVNFYKNFHALDQKEKSILTYGTDKQDRNELPPYEPDKYEYYTIRKGDNIWLISKKFKNTSGDDIIQLNNITDTQNLKIGQRLRIRPKG